MAAAHHGTGPPTHCQAVKRIGSGVDKAVGGFVTANLLASLLAGLVAIVELAPFIGPVVATSEVAG